MATTNGATNSFPPVILDTTLYDLLCAEPGDVVEALSVFKPNSDSQYGGIVPFNDKYIIHSAQVASAEDLGHLQLENCAHLLMFFAGPMDVIFIGAEGYTDDKTLSAESVDKNAKRSFGVIQQSQQPNIITYKNTDDFIKRHDGKKIRWGFAQDFAENLPGVLHPEVTYKLNSKRWLAECDLRSANDRILDNDIKCSAHTTANGLWHFGGKDCKGCTEGVEQGSERILDVLRTAKIPYVLKLAQSLSAVGTNIVENDEDRKELVEKMTDYLTNYIPRITKENAYLHTTALVLSEFVKGPTHALNFYVKMDGSVVFLGACNQLSTGESGRQSTAITYADQPELEKKFRKTLDDIGRVLNKEGYHGPCGADIMEDPNTGRLFTIDLNVRMALSLVLYVLKGHFNDNHGFGMATVYECCMLTISRDELEEKFAKEFSEARIVLMGAARMGEKEQWAYGVIVAGEDTEAIEKVTDRILEYEAKDVDTDGGGA